MFPRPGGGRGGNNYFRPRDDLAQQPVEDVTVNVGQAAVDAVVADRQLRVVDAEEVEHGGVDVVPVAPRYVIHTVPAADRVVADPAVQEVVVVPAGDDIDRAEAVDGVVAASP